MNWDEEYDIVCVGSGIGGLSTALTGAARGATAIVLEKFHLLGGVSGLSSVRMGGALFFLFENVSRSYS
jgi:3-oxosteroid 1-dehydrogenase